jgi:hypothetical protein
VCLQIFNSRACQLVLGAGAMQASTSRLHAFQQRRKRELFPLPPPAKCEIANLTVPR